MKQFEVFRSVHPHPQTRAGTWARDTECIYISKAYFSRIYISFITIFFISFIYIHRENWV